LARWGSMTLLGGKKGGMEGLCGVEPCRPAWGGGLDGPAGERAERALR